MKIKGKAIDCHSGSMHVKKDGSHSEIEGKVIFIVGDFRGRINQTELFITSIESGSAIKRLSNNNFRTVLYYKWSRKEINDDLFFLGFKPDSILDEILLKLKFDHYWFQKSEILKRIVAGLVGSIITAAISLVIKCPDVINTNRSYIQKAPLIKAKLLAQDTIEIPQKLYKTIDKIE